MPRVPDRQRGAKAGRLATLHRSADGVQAGGGQRCDHQETAEGTGDEPEMPAGEHEQRAAEERRDQAVQQPGAGIAREVDRAALEPAQRLAQRDRAGPESAGGLDGRRALHGCDRATEVCLTA
jgi:hypothetical protein